MSPPASRSTPGDLPAPCLTIVIPVYKNAATLRELHQRLCVALESAGQAFEIIFVDDGCPEDSARIIAELAQADPRVRGILMARNIGQHRAVTLALAHARGSQAVIMDADLQDPPESIPALIAPLSQGCAAVFAKREGAFQSEHRQLTSRIFKGLVRLLAGTPPDAGMFIALNQTAFQALLAMNEPRPYIVGMVALTGLPVASVPVKRATRSIGQSAYSAVDRLRLALNGLRVILAIKFGWRRWFPNRPSGDPIPIKAYIGQGFEQ